MKKTFIAIALASSAALAGMALPLTSAHAQSEASIALSALPVASVVGAASVAGAAATASVAVPAVLSVGGATLTVISVQAVAGGTVYLLERASDGAQVSINVSGKVANGVSAAVGTTVLVTVISSGVVISAAG